MTIKTRPIVLAGVLVLAFLVAGAVVAGPFEDVPPDPAAMTRAIDSAPMLQVADIEAVQDEPARGVFVQLTETGFLCIWDAPSASSRQRQGGCNRADDPLGRSTISASLAYDGGPSMASVRGARLSGLASGDVASVRVLMSDGTFRIVKLKKAKVGSDEFQAFGHRIKRADLRKGIGPTAIVAYDAAGNEIGRQPTGIG